MPSGSIGNLEKNGVKRILACRDYTVATSLEVFKLHHSTKSSWEQMSESLKKNFGLQKSQHVEDNSFNSVMHETMFADKRHILIRDKSGGQKQRFSRNSIDHFVDSKDHVTPVLFRTEIKANGSSNVTMDNVNGREIENRRLNGFSLTKISNTVAQTEGSLSTKIFEHQKERNVNEIELASHGLIVSKSNQTKEKLPAAIDVEIPSNSKEAYRHLDIKKRLASIYSKVLVVNNVFMAEEVVGKLIHEYRDLVHACDTEGVPVQKGATDCGLFAMRYMKEICYDKELQLAAKWLRRGNLEYSDADINEIRIDFAKYFMKRHSS